MPAPVLIISPCLEDFAVFRRVAADFAADWSAEACWAICCWGGFFGLGAGLAADGPAGAEEPPAAGRAGFAGSLGGDFSDFFWRFDMVEEDRTASTGGVARIGRRK